MCAGIEQGERKWEVLNSKHPDGCVLSRAPMPSNFHAQLSTLTSSFASDVLDAIKGASLADLRTANGSRVGRAPAAKTKAPTEPPSAAKRPRAGGRLARRSPEDIAGALDKITALVRKHKDGLRAEEIRASLGMQSKEMPRVLSEGLTKRKLKKKGEKRATTYFAA